MYYPSNPVSIFLFNDKIHPLMSMESVLLYLPFKLVTGNLVWKMLVVSSKSYIIKPLNKQWNILFLSNSQIYILAFKQTRTPSTSSSVSVHRACGSAGRCNEKVEGEGLKRARGYSKLCYAHAIERFRDGETCDFVMLESYDPKNT